MKDTSLSCTHFPVNLNTFQGTQDLHSAKIAGMILASYSSSCNFFMSIINIIILFHVKSFLKFTA